MTHYKMRTLEAILFLLSIVILASKAGITKSMHVSECSIIGGLREFVLHFVQNSFMALWVIAMLINITSIKGTSMIDLQNRTINIKTPKFKYAVTFACSGLIIILNALTLKLNISLCSGSNYDIVKKAIANKQEYVSMYTHWLLTLFNMAAFGGAIAAGGYTFMSTYKKQKHLSDKEKQEKKNK